MRTANNRPTEKARGARISQRHIQRTPMRGCDVENVGCATANHLSLTRWQLPMRPLQRTGNCQLLHGCTQHHHTHPSRPHPYTRDDCTRCEEPQPAHTFRNGAWCHIASQNYTLATLALQPLVIAVGSRWHARQRLLNHTGLVQGLEAPSWQTQPAQIDLFVVLTNRWCGAIHAGWRVGQFDGRAENLYGA